jgi:hypothetical protein
MASRERWPLMLFFGENEYIVFVSNLSVWRG